MDTNEPMTPLSPAAQAVLEAAEKQTDLDFRYAPQIAAAALRAAVEQVLPADPNESAHFTNEAIRLNRMGTRASLLAIAAELEGGN